MTLAGDRFYKSPARLGCLKVSWITGAHDVNREQGFLRTDEEKRCTLDRGPHRGRKCDGRPERCILQGSRTPAAAHRGDVQQDQVRLVEGELRWENR